MKVQVIVAAMNQVDCLLINKMNIATDAIVGNQCDRCFDETYVINGKTVTYYSRKDRGVGLNRNVGLAHSAENCILTFADEDMVFNDGYEAIIQNAFHELPEADAIVFNINNNGGRIKTRTNNKIGRVHIYNALNYGAARLSVKSNIVRREGITFHTCFGGGTRYCCGEDTLFIAQMLKHGLKIYTYPACIADVNQNTSTWFTGYDKKFLHDQGALFAALSKSWAKLLCLQALMRHPYIFNESKFRFVDAYRVMKSGIRSYYELAPFDK